MIIKIVQTASSIKQTYEIESENFYYGAKAGSFSRLQPITLVNRENTIKGVYHLSKPVNYIPLRYLFGKPNITRAFRIYKNGNHYGSVVYSKDGFNKNRYLITSDRREEFECYDLYNYRKSFHYISIYRGNVQIALVETYLLAVDYKYTHKLYLLDDYAELAELFSFFVVYYAGYNFAERLHMNKYTIANTGHVITWRVSGYSDKYDENWRETHFPNENFFGKMSLFDN